MTVAIDRAGRITTTGTILVTKDVDTTIYFAEYSIRPLILGVEIVNRHTTDVDVEIIWDKFQNPAQRIQLFKSTVGTSGPVPICYQIPKSLLDFDLLIGRASVDNVIDITVSALEGGR